MGRLVFDKCCFCIELKTGCFIIGYMSLAFYSILTILAIVGLATGSYMAAHPEMVVEEGSDNQDVATAGGIMVIVFSALAIIFLAILLTFVIVLLVGLHKNKPGHVKAYVIYSCIFIILTVIALVSSIFSPNKDAGSISQTLTSIAWNVYTTLVIRSHYFAMKNPERGPAIYNTA